MATATPPTLEITEPNRQEPHVLDQVVEEASTTQGPRSPTASDSSSPPSSPPVTKSAAFPAPEGGPDGKYVCKLERKKSSIRRKRVLTAVTADNKPVNIPLVEYGDKHETYDDIAQRIMHGADVTLSVRTLREKLGMLTAIRDVCGQKIDVRLAREERIRRRIRIKRAMVLWTYGFVFLSFLVVGLKIVYVLARIYYGFIKDHIHEFRSGPAP